MFDFTPEKLRSLLFIIPIVLLSVALHEFAHCWTTDRLGDDTPRRLGRVTLNPLVHLDPIGTLLIVFTSISGFGIGWGKASPFNPANFRHPARDRMLTAIAGPVANILQALGWASIAMLLTAAMGAGVDRTALLVCQYGVLVNIGLGMFNLLPIYPLDGHHVLSFLAPRGLRPLIDNPAWMYVMLLLVFTRTINVVLTPLFIYGLRFVHLATGWLPLM